MVASFRDAVSHWLDVVLPADLYVARRRPRPATRPLPPGLREAAPRVPGVARAETQRACALPLDPARPAVLLIARPLAARAAPAARRRAAPPRRRARPRSTSARRWSSSTAPARRPLPAAAAGRARRPFFVRGIWRDYVRQFGAIAITPRDFSASPATGAINDVALWLAPGADRRGRRRACAARRRARHGALLQSPRSREIRATSLRIFDRSFAVTYWLQAVAIAIGLFGIAASSGPGAGTAQGVRPAGPPGLSARRCSRSSPAKARPGRRRRAAGLALGLAVSVVLVQVVNPQSFHWTMDLLLPGCGWLRWRRGGRGGTATAGSPRARAIGRARCWR